ncbi:hypothetical protein L873DRAFT_1799104 [Choiromyces venosus 120613-1]|uniref:Uncharacterized protein n=1 Tax=Choiromyces venosus 120613-1 TaxID=1336337 RepID=A0A3N4K583_9PEZI|nr:hypothetical protein L873DRAFT_1799104 [Choiromyces venosus 120613-1]
MAIEMIATGTAPSLTIASAMVRAVPMMKLMPEEERIVLEYCYFCYHLGFPSIIWQLREIATSIIQKRNPQETLRKIWEEAFKRRHPEAKTGLSKQLDFI